MGTCTQLQINWSGDSTANAPTAGSVASEHIVGIWQAFKSLQFRKRFEKQLVASGQKKSLAKTMMQHFYNKVVDADKAGVFHRRLNDCISFDEMETILSHLFDAWKNNLKYSWIEDLFFRYLSFLRQFYLANGNLDDTKENNLTKSSKIQLTYRDGTTEILMPHDALKKAVLTIGPDMVASMNLRIINDKLLINYEPRENRYYEKLTDRWWLLTKGVPKAKYQIIFILINRHSGLIAKAKLL